MKHIILAFLLVLFMLFPAPGQETTAPCNCVVSPYNDRGTPDTSFLLKNGRSLVLCGSREEADGEVTFSDFTLNVCGATEILGHWGALASCRILKKGNELTIQRVVNLPVGREFGYVPTVLFIDKITIPGRNARMNTTLNAKARKYSRAEISAVLAEYEASPRAVNERTEELLLKLFVCALGKNPKAQKLFASFDKDNTGLEGDLLNLYVELKRLLNLAGIRP
ncbi:MAG: hypothetical protein V1913_00510 [Fibrobacterota bacterium]